MALSGYLFDDEKWINLSPQPGRYELFIAVYDQASVMCLPLAGRADGLHPIGSIVAR